MNDMKYLTAGLLCFMLSFPAKADEEKRQFICGLLEHYAKTVLEFRDNGYTYKEVYEEQKQKLPKSEMKPFILNIVKDAYAIKYHKTDLAKNHYKKVLFAMDTKEKCLKVYKG